MTPYERLLAEAIPTGRFGRPDTSQEQQKPAEESPRVLADRLAALDTAQYGWKNPDPRAVRDRQRPRRPTYLTAANRDAA